MIGPFKETAFGAFHDGIDEIFEMARRLKHILMHDVCGFYLVIIVLLFYKELSPDILKISFQHRAQMSIIIEPSQPSVNIRRRIQKPLLLKESSKIRCFFSHSF